MNKKKTFFRWSYAFLFAFLHIFPLPTSKMFLSNNNITKKFLVIIFLTVYQMILFGFFWSKKFYNALSRPSNSCWIYCIWRSQYLTYISDFENIKKNFFYKTYSLHRQLTVLLILHFSRPITFFIIPVTAVVLSIIFDLRCRKLSDDNEFIVL